MRLAPVCGVRCQWKFTSPKYVGHQNNWGFMLCVDLLCSSGTFRFGGYLRNAGSMGQTFVWPEYMTERLLTVQNICHSCQSDSASCECSSGRCIWDWYFAVMYSAKKRVPASYLATPFCFFLSPVLKTQVSVHQNWTANTANCSVLCLYIHNASFVNILYACMLRMGVFNLCLCRMYSCLVLQIGGQTAVFCKFYRFQLLFLCLGPCTKKLHLYSFHQRTDYRLDDEGFFFRLFSLQEPCVLYIGRA